jgi:hypothetical protein
MPVDPTLVIDTTQLPPAEAAMQIARHYELPPIEAGQVHEPRHPQV